MTFGHTLAQHLGSSVDRYAVSSTAAGDWLKPKLCPSGQPCEFQYGYSTPKGDFEGPSLLAPTTPARDVISLEERECEM